MGFLSNDSVRNRCNNKAVPLPHFKFLLSDRNGLFSWEHQYRYLEIKPVPLVVSSVLATNIGSAATVLGNPIGILIALRSSLGFEDFLVYALPVSVIVLLASTFVLYLWNRKYIREITSKLISKEVENRFPVSDSMNTGMAINLAIFCLLIFY